MNEVIEKRIKELEEDIAKHQSDYDKLPTIIVSKKGAVVELKKLLGEDSEKK